MRIRDANFHLTIRRKPGSSLVTPFISEVLLCTGSHSAVCLRDLVGW